MSNGTYSFSESDYRFTNPVRYFTASDPYYWEVDNIPLKQLQENDLWLKDQIEDGFKNLRFSFGRSEFQELLPYSEGVDNIVRVKPGRFTARINSIADTRLQLIERLRGEIFNQADRWKLATYENEELQQSIDKINSVIADEALFMNGLVERVFTYTVNNTYNTFESDVGPWDPNTPDSWKVLSPLFQTLMWPNAAWGSGNNTIDLGGGNRAIYGDVSFVGSERGIGQGMIALWGVENAFLKYWKGVYRLAVVDVPAELSIEVPPFNQRDFDYYDENGQLQQNNTAETRVDLLFIYSKPVDASSVKVKTNITEYREITEPELGLVRGAGVILRKAPINSTGSPSMGDTANVGDLDADGNVQILASPADQVNQNAGFKNLQVRGSFPAPDDIMNMSPLLVESLESSDPKLIGQSILPVAYVVVRRDAAINENGQTIITTEDIIDIRPLMRTSELSYNERAGIAAAVPQISISNPVVSYYQLKQTVDKISDDYKERIDSIRDGTDGGPRIVGTGLVQGGFRYGPESAIRNWWIEQDNITTAEGTARWRERMNYPTSHATNYFPEWDIASWVPSDNRGEYPNDCVHICRPNPTGPYYQNPAIQGHIAKSSREYSGGRLNDLINESTIYYCKKTIRIDRRDVEWMDFYKVSVNYVNCLPLTSPNSFNSYFVSGGFSYNNSVKGGSASIFVETRKDEFTIYCSWIGLQQDLVSSKINPGLYANLFNHSVPYTYPIFGRTAGLNRFRDYPEITAGHIILNSEFSEADRNGYQDSGVCILPTVQFEITGYPRNYPGMRRSLQAERPTIRLQ